MEGVLSSRSALPAINTRAQERTRIPDELVEIERRNLFARFCLAPGRFNDFERTRDLGRHVLQQEHRMGKKG